MQKLTGTDGVEWRECARFPGYMVSNLGQVWSPKSGKIIKGISAGQMEYLCIDFGGTSRAYVHRLICEAFHGPAQEGMQVRHIDGNNRNNRADNLAWGTVRENHADKYLHGTVLHGERNPMAKLTWATVEKMREERMAYKTPFYKLAEKYNVSTMTAYRAVTNQSWSMK